MYTFCHERDLTGKQWTVCPFCGKGREAFEQARDNAIACQKRLTEDPSTDTSDITKFASELNTIFVSLAEKWNEKHEGQMLPPDIRAVANLAVTWLESIANDEKSRILSAWAENKIPNPYAMYLLTSTNASYLRNAAFAGHSEAIGKYMREELNQQDKSNFIQILEFSLRNIEMMEDIESLLEDVRTLTASVDDPNMNYMIIEAHLEKYAREGKTCDQEEAVKLFVSRSLSDEHRLGLAWRELRNGATEMARTVALDLLNRTTEQEKMTGASLLCEVILKMQAKGHQWNDILPEQGELPWGKVSTIPFDHLHRLWSLWKIETLQGDEELLTAFSAMKRAFWGGNWQIWHDLNRLFKQQERVELRLLALKTLVEICTENCEASLERTGAYLVTYKGFMDKDLRTFEGVEKEKLAKVIAIHQERIALAKEHLGERRKLYEGSQGRFESVEKKEIGTGDEMTRREWCPLTNEYFLEFAKDIVLEGKVLRECLAYVDDCERKFGDEANESSLNEDPTRLEIWRRLYVSLTFTSGRYPAAQKGAEVIGKLICKSEEAARKAAEEEAARKAQEEEAARKAAEEEAARKAQEEEAARKAQEEEAAQKAAEEEAARKAQGEAA